MSPWKGGPINPQDDGFVLAPTPASETPRPFDKTDYTKAAQAGSGDNQWRYPHSAAQAGR